MDTKNKKSKSIISNLIFDPHEFWNMILGYATSSTKLDIS